MRGALRLLPVIVRNWLRTRGPLQLEILALRHQLAVLQREQSRRPRLTSFDRIFWIWLYRLWPGCLDALAIMKPETVVRLWLLKTPSVAKVQGFRSGSGDGYGMPQSALDRIGSPLGTCSIWVVIIENSVRCGILPSNGKSAANSAQRVSGGTRPSRASKQG